MNGRIQRFTILGVLLGAAAFAAADDAKPAAGGAKPKSAMHAAARPVIWPADKLEWKDVPGVAGVRMAVLWGDPAKGPHGAIHRFPAGFKAPLHTHTADLKCVVISGTIIHGDASGNETRLGPGSYMTNPHTDKHTTACDAASECLMFAEGNRAFDIKMVETKAMEKKASK